MSAGASPRRLGATRRHDELVPGLARYADGNGGRSASVPGLVLSTGRGGSRTAGAVPGRNNGRRTC
ncbi:hypothetical protein SAMN05444858_11073 [Micromonospora avicenniae]|uniref:Uncharacterized protein n=1 Tax=Micromonospora avicenniae TaxID=1198245 RepID=A0A1N7B2L8_9ACTN|nr:hypothetical protein SAMN05444858_11073 [Micromonospora avicenniae]